MSTARWSLLSKVVSKARSSHSLSVTNDGLLLLYGGELVPRTPVDTAVASIANDGSVAVKGSVHAFDLRNVAARTNQPWVMLSPKSDSSIPEPRVGATVVWDKVSESLYLWGGRGGVDMAPLDREQAGLWKGHVEQTSPAVEWERLVATNEDESPEPRSYHASVLSEVRILRYLNGLGSRLWKSGETLHSCWMPYLGSFGHSSFVRFNNEDMALTG
jgi:hypothetical protein